MVEAIASSIEDVLVNALSFKLPEGATYISERKSCTFYASGANEYGPSGVKLVKLVCASEGWLDPGTVRVQFDVNNKANLTPSVTRCELRPLSGGWCFFNRLRILCGGVIVEDISDFARTQEMFTTLISKNSKVNIDAEGFGLDDFDYKTEVNDDNFPGLMEGESQTILFTPLSGLLSQPKWIHLRYAPLTFELELVNSYTAPVVDNTKAPFTATNTSSLWSISNVQIKADIIKLDNSLENHYVELLMSGKTIPINYSTYITSYQSILSGTGGGQEKVRLNVARSISRLKSVFVTFDNPGVHSAIYKEFNSFYSPMFSIGDGPILGRRGEMEFSLQVGGKQMPEQSIKSHGEAYYNLRKCMGVQSSNVHSFNITAQEYRRLKFILAIDCETLLQAGFTGLNTRSGQLLNIKFDQTGATGNLAQNMYIVLHSDNVLQIGDSGVAVYD